MAFAPYPVSHPYPAPRICPQCKKEAIDACKAEMAKGKTSNKDNTEDTDDTKYAVNNTDAQDVIDFFESSFASKEVIPESLEMVWLRKAVSRYCLELETITYDSEIRRFGSVLDEYVISTLAQFMYEYYQEREVSKANKRVSIVGKDLSIDGSNGTKTAEKAHLTYVSEKARDMVENQKPVAFL